MKREIVLAICMGIDLVACCSKGVKREHVTQIHKVALVGFEFSKEKAASFSVGDSNFKGTGIVLESDEAAHVYQDLRAALTNEMKWTVLPSEDLTKSALYRRELDSQIIKMSWNGGAGVDDRDRARAKGVLLSQRINQMTRDERTRLIDELGVDALVVARVDIALEAGILQSLTGLKGGAPAGTTYFDVYNRECSVWWDHCAKGDKVGSGTISVGGISISPGDGTETSSAAQDSFRVLMVHFKEASESK